jgi:hypothetical protein
MRYLTRAIWIKIQNPIRGAKFDYFGVRSQQQWLTVEGTFTTDARDDDATGRWARMVGDMTFSIYGRESGVGLIKSQKLIGRYKSLEAALATLRDMGALHPDAMKTWLERYVEGE